MDELLIQALHGSFSPEQAQREEAEAFLTKAEQAPGYLQALVMIWVNQAVCGILCAFSSICSVG